jgi:hypothetical protein
LVCAARSFPRLLLADVGLIEVLGGILREREVLRGMLRERVVTDQVG